MLDHFPLGVLFFLTCALVLVALEGGFGLGCRVNSTDKADEKTNVGEMVQSTLGLVAFILAFTFSMAADRFNDRRLLIIEEANSIGTTYLRCDFLPEQNKKETQKLLRKYVFLRTKAAQIEPISERIAEAEKVQDALWAQTVAAGKANNSPVTSVFIQSMNETLDLQAKRIAAALYARLPDTIWAALYIMILLGMLAMGYHTGLSRKRNWLASTVMIASFAIVITIIADLDRPTEGFMRADQTPLTDLAKKIGPPDPQERPTTH